MEPFHDIEGFGYNHQQLYIWLFNWFVERVEHRIRPFPADTPFPPGFPAPPPLTMRQFVQNLGCHCRIEPGAFAAADILLERVFSNHEAYREAFHLHNSFPTVLTALIVSCKMANDIPFSNAHWARLSGYGLSTVNEFEWCMISELLGGHTALEMDEVRARISHVIHLNTRQQQ
eukprot:comp17205_c0_seq1/m.28631 comp17205_c0_seq1/g.28631  ORF comp17205_c0_seq1/g.28631 comp17205_c0_seq1/m.28631 type:complete len:174 (+) comp17205_c0_seq1:228-749(+)